LTTKRVLGGFVFSLSLIWLGQISSAIAADSVADFYKGKSVFLQIGSGVGGNYDTMGRLFARYMSKYIPGNPNIVAQNVPGLQLANQFANTTPRDGTYFGVFTNGMPTVPLIDPQAGHYDTRKFFFLGSPNRQNQALGVWRTAKAKTIDDLFKKETIIGATAPGFASFDYPRLANVVLDSKFKIIPGYQGMGDIKVAMQQGEVDGTFVSLSNVKTDFADAIGKKDFMLIAAFGMKQSPNFVGVPLMPLGDSVEDHQLFALMYARQDYGTPFLTPPDVPPDREAALRRAFEATMQDAGFLDEAQKLRIDVDPVSGSELSQLTDRLYETPPAVISRIRSILSSHAK
jgi:tripartite-type tricarboxylate transporter receptor subunit TctC